MRHKGLVPNAPGFSLVIMFLVSCGASQPTPTIPSTAAPTARVLFVGNSLTFFNDLPEMFTKLALSGGYDVGAEMSARGASTLSDHAAFPTTLDMIEQQDWDFVILQEQSDTPAILEQRNEQMYPAIRLLDTKIREGGAKTILFLTWGRRASLSDAGIQDFVAMQEQLQLGYMEIANELDLMVAPVGIAWQHGISQDPQLDLWRRDGIHPSEEGSYLTACVFFAVIYQQSPEGLTYRAGLSEETAQFMQAIAAEIVLEDPGLWNIP